MSKDKDPRRPVAVWRSQDLHMGEAVPSLTVILRTRGCRWNRCKMCSFASEGLDVTSENMEHQLRAALARADKDTKVIKLYTSGSFFDPLEVPPDVRRYVLRSLSSLPGVEKLVVESRPEFVTEEAVEESLSWLPLEVGIGLESSSDLVRNAIIGKGFMMEDFRKAANLLRSRGARVKSYLLLKPPLLSEGQALRDSLSSARLVADMSDIISLNLCNVQRGTLVERLWRRGEFRSPWLWSAVAVLERVSSPIICDPVGAGSSRGPHNCGRCDEVVAAAIRTHYLTQDLTPFNDLDCPCRVTWEKVLEMEELSMASPMI